MSEGSAVQNNKAGMWGEYQVWEAQASNLSRLVSDGLNEEAIFLPRPESYEGIIHTDSLKIE